MFKAAAVWFLLIGGFVEMRMRELGADEQTLSSVTFTTVVLHHFLLTLTLGSTNVTTGLRLS